MVAAAVAGRQQLMSLLPVCGAGQPFAAAGLPCLHWQAAAAAAGRCAEVRILQSAAVAAGADVFGACGAC